MEQENKGVEKKRRVSPAVIILVVVAGLFLVGFIGYGGSSNLEERSSSIMDDIEKQVARDAVSQYEIAKRQGDKIQICVQAGMVTAAYLQAQDESSYRFWKDIEEADCTAAGMPRFNN